MRSNALCGLIVLFSASASATPIDDKYAEFGGASTFLGAATGPELTAADKVGRFRHYAGGSIFWHPSTGAHVVYGLIRGRWAALGWERSYLGYPMTDEHATFDGGGRVTKFQGGQLIWRPTTNQVSDVKSTDLIVDWPFRAGEPWRIVQATSAGGKPFPPGRPLSVIVQSDWGEPLASVRVPMSAGSVTALRYEVPGVPAYNNLRITVANADLRGAGSERASGTSAAFSVQPNVAATVDIALTPAPDR